MQSHCTFSSKDVCPPPKRATIVCTASCDKDVSPLDSRGFGRFRIPSFQAHGGGALPETSS
jgi:hypothetical protein